MLNIFGAVGRVFRRDWRYQHDEDLRFIGGEDMGAKISNGGSCDRPESGQHYHVKTGGWTQDTSTVRKLG